MLLLAILIGYPDEATEVLGRPLDVNEETNWWGFIEALKQEFTALEPADVKPEVIEGAQRDELQKDEPQKDASAVAPARWEEFIERLEKTRAMGPSLIAEGQSCKDFKTWAPRVARYSFQSGRVLLKQMLSDAPEQMNARQSSVQ